jgi:hypothetical protein
MGIHMSDESKHYSQDEVNHIVARETAKSQMNDLKSNLGLMNQANTQALADINAKITQIFSIMSEQNKEQRDEREKLIDGLKKEIEKDFASKIDMINISNRLDQLWIKISVAIMTAVTIGGLLGWLINTAINAAGAMK